MFVYVFADRLLLRMNMVDDPGTQAIVSTLIFDHDGDLSRSLPEGAGDLDEDMRGNDREARNPEDGDVPAVAQTSEKAMGKQVEV